MSEPEFPRSFALEIGMSVVANISAPLATAFVACLAEAQLLEAALKDAIKEDICVFADASEQNSFLKVLEKMTLGQAKNVAVGSSSQKEIATCVGFFDFVRMQWGFTNRAEPELISAFQDAVKRRNRIAHLLLAELSSRVLPIPDAMRFLNESQKLFFELRALVARADTLSSKTGSVASDGSSLSRFKTTSSLE